MPDVRVAVIDSGVHPDHPHIDAARLLPGVSIDGEGLVMPEDPLDRLGHGTAVAAALQEKAPGAWLVPVRLFHDRLHTNALALSAAIDWCVARGDIDLINLSLGLPAGPRLPALLAQAVERALARGVALVAARETGEGLCWPGALPGVLGVGLDWECPREGWRWRSDDVPVASGYPRPIPGVPLRRNLYGISFAVAQVSGFAARVLPGLPQGGARPAALAQWLRDNAGAPQDEGCPSVHT